MERLLIILLALSLVLVMHACLPYEEKPPQIEIDYSDPEFRRIHRWQDTNDTDSLILYFTNADPSLRYAAALAFGSTRDSAALDDLYVLLKDKVDDVRAAAAYSIGQVGSQRSQTSLIEAFNQNDTIGRYRKANRAILEAVGKCGTESMLQAMSTISTYQEKDTMLLEGQAWGIYRFAIRGITSETGSARMVELVTNQDMPLSVRFIAANYLSRAQNIQLDTFKIVLSNTFQTEEDPRVKMALAIALGKCRRERAMNTLINNFKTETDYRVRCNTISALRNYDYAAVRETVFAALKDPNPNVANRAARFLLDHGVRQDAPFYWRSAKDTLPLEYATPVVPRC